MPTVFPDSVGYLDVFPLLRAVVPTFDGSFEAGAVDPPSGEFVSIALLVRHLIRCLASGRTEDLAGLFAVVDWILVQGDEEAQHLITQGLFDDLLNSDEYGDTLCQPADFGPWLGPRARQLRSVAAVLESDE
jgi:hypothetical protein